MKIVFMGTPDFSVGALESLIKAGYEVTAVVTQPDKPKGRSRHLQMTPVKECAVKYGIPVFQPHKLREPDAVEKLRSYEADVYVTAAFGQILSEEVLSIPRLGCINIHASLLPAYRGSAPIQRVIMDGKDKTGVTIMYMDKGIDTGDIICQKTVDIADTDTGESLTQKLSDIGAGMITEIMPRIENGTAGRTKQDDSRSNYAKMLDKSEGLVNWDDDAVRIERLVRALDPWPSAYTYYNGRMMKIWHSEVSTLCRMREECSSEGKEEFKELSDSDERDYVPGTVAGVSKDSIFVNTGDGLLKITEIQAEGKKRMSVHDFLLGISISSGDRLNSEKG